MKIVFFGTDAFSIKALEACLHAPGMEIALVVTTPAKKKGRGLKLVPSEVLEYARAKNLPAVEYPKLRDPQISQELLALRPDLFVVASYGKLIPNNLLEIPKYRLNVHPSLLPQYRGSAPIHWPILKGDTETGVSIIDIAEKLDAGEIYAQEKIAIDPRANAEQLTSELARFSYGVLKKVLDQVQRGQLRGVPQKEADATMAPQLSKQDGELSFLSMTAVAMDRKVRGLQPWPGAYFFLKGERIAILETAIPIAPCNRGGEESPSHSGESTDTCHSRESGNPELGSPIKTFGDDSEKELLPGTLLSIEKDGSIQVSTQQGILKILKVKPEGKNAMTAADFVRGRRCQVKETLPA